MPRRQDRAAAAASVIAVDSGVWIDHFRGDATPELARLRDIIGNEEALLVVCDAVLFDVLRGVRDDAQAARVERDLRRFRVEPVSAGPDDAVCRQHGATEFGLHTGRPALGLVAEGLAAVVAHRSCAQRPEVVVGVVDGVLVGGAERDL